MLLQNLQKYVNGGITEENGNFIVQYLYDEWGSLLSIDTADEDGSVAYREIAEANPLRYRGYYYDAETGYYYLQSRYYDSEICRFINADDLIFVDTFLKFDNNIFLYCYNNSLNLSDLYGNKTDIPLDYEDWTYRRENNMTNEHGDRHIHVDSKRLNKHYSQDEDGFPHDGNQGSPPKKVKKRLKEKTGWDWDAKEKSYEQKQKEEKSSQEFSLNFDFGFSTEDVWTAILYSAILAIVIASFGWLIIIFGGIGAVAIA